MKNTTTRIYTQILFTIPVIALATVLLLSSCGSASLPGRNIVNAAENQTMTDEAMTDKPKADEAMTDKPKADETMANETDMVITDTEKETKTDDVMVTEEKATDEMTKTDEMSATDGIMMEKEFSLPDVNGTTVNLSDFAGKKIYVKFWATWCPICLSGLDEFIQLTTDMSEQEDTVILTIVSPGTKGEMTKEDFIAWYEKQGYTFPVLLDQDGNVARNYNIRGYPTSVFIDTKGKIAQSRPGHVSNDDIHQILTEIK